MKKPKLLIASVLKPVDDTRMYEKFGLSIGQTNKYEVNIIGFCTKKLLQSDTIQFHPIFCFRRLSPLRLFAPIRFFFKTVSISPEILIVNTHELLIAGCIYSILFRKKLIYDIRENHFLNLKYGKAFPKTIGVILAYLVRLVESITAPFVHHFILAEQSYADELPFIKQRHVCIENKYKRLDRKIRSSQRNHFQLLFSGTIAETTGIFQAISLAEQLHEHDNRYHLVIAGHCAQPNLLKKIKGHLKDSSFIHLIGGSDLVYHQRIVELILSSGAGLIYYPKNPSTQSSRPTKLYEYLANDLFILFDNSATWSDIIVNNEAGYGINFENPDCILAIHTAIQEGIQSSISKKSPFLWKGESKKLLNLLEINNL